MSISVTLANMPTSGTDVSVKLIDQTQIDLVQTEVLPNGRRTTYVYTDGDPTKMTNVVVTQTLDSKNGIVGTSVRLRTIQVVNDSDLGDTEVAPIEVLIAFNTPGPMEDAGLVLDMIGTAYSLLFNGVTSKVPNEGIINKLNFGITEGLY
jgi:hypothetical protein